jgi:tetratricopeptide (TPR) repeat protein
MTGRHLIALEKAQAALDSSAGCIQCEADQLRRLAYVYVWSKRWADADSSLQGATRRYRLLGNSGHDLLGNGIANCLLLKCILRYFTASPEAGAVEARRGLKVLTGNESPILFGSLIAALAKCLQPSKNPREVQESQELLDWCFDNFKFAEVRSVARAMLFWLRGNLAAVMGRIDDAIQDLTLALDDARALELEKDAASILADLGALNPDPREIRGYIEDFCDWNDAGDLVVPSWFSNLDAEIRAVYDIALKSRKQIDVSTFVALREAAGGESRMPAFIIASQANSSILGQRSLN